MPDQDLMRHTEAIRVLSMILTKVSRSELEQRLAAESVGLGPLPFGVLHVLARTEAETIKDLSRLMVLAPATLVPAIDALERGEYVVRDPDRRDRRRTLLRVTEAGHQLMERVPAMRRDDDFTQAVALLNPDQRDQLITLMRSLVAGLPDGPEMLAQAMPPEDE